MTPAPTQVTIPIATPKPAPQHANPFNDRAAQVDSTEVDFEVVPATQAVASLAGVSKGNDEDLSRFD